MGLKTEQPGGKTGNTKGFTSTDGPQHGFMPSKDSFPGRSRTPQPQRKSAPEGSSGPGTKWPFLPDKPK